MSLFLLDSYTSDAMRMELFLRKDVELLVLLHQLVVLGRQETRASLRPIVPSAALARVLPKRRRKG